MTDELSEKAIYQLNQVVQSVLGRYGFAPLYGPADRYGVVEWAASVKDLKPFERQHSFDTGSVALDVAISAWPTPDAQDFAAETQVTVGARSSIGYFTRWHFDPVTLTNLLDQNECEQILTRAVDSIYSSKRTLSAIQAVLSPENAPSDMTVLPVFEGAAAAASHGVR